MGPLSITQLADTGRLWLWLSHLQERQFCRETKTTPLLLLQSNLRKKKKNTRTHNLFSLKISIFSLTMIQIRVSLYLHTAPQQITHLSASILADCFEHTNISEAPKSKTWLYWIPSCIIWNFWFNARKKKIRFFHLQFRSSTGTFKREKWLC